MALQELHMRGNASFSCRCTAASEMSNGGNAFVFKKLSALLRSEAVKNKCQPERKVSAESIYSARLGPASEENSNEREK